MESIYLDHAATTPVRREVQEEMLPYLSEHFGNTSSTHRWGRRAASALEEARARIAKALCCQANEIRFVRGGTESDNLAVLGRANVAREAGRDPSLIVSTVEHSAVLQSARAATRMSGTLTEIPTDGCGNLDMERLEDTLSEPADLVSMMWVNNELGTLFPISSIVEMAHETGVCVHTDAVQALGKVPVNLADTDVDLLSITGHKIYGPKGIAVLFVREGTELLPELFGGGQEGGLRPGTSDVGGAVGLACAVELAVGEQAEEAERLSSLRDRLWSGLREQVSDLVLHGDGAERAPHILNIGVPSADSEALIAGLDVEGVAVSSGSACLSGGTEPSHVIQALYRDADPLASIRFSMGKLVGEDEIEAALERTSRVFGRLRETSQRS